MGLDASRAREAVRVGMEWGRVFDGVVRFVALSLKENFQYSARYSSLILMGGFASGSCFEALGLLKFIMCVCLSYTCCPFYFIVVRDISWTQASTHRVGRYDNCIVDQD
jgi:hypothetical protein